MCEKGFRKIIDRFLIDCIEIKKPKFKNCREISDNEPFKCLECHSGYYKDNGLC